MHTLQWIRLNGVWCWPSQVLEQEEEKEEEQEEQFVEGDEEEDSEAEVRP